MNTIAALLMSVWVASPQEVPYRESITFIGFSKDEQAAAMRVRIEKPAPLESGDRDRYTVIRMLDLETGETIAHFRQGRILRVNVNGRRVRVPAVEMLSADNPIWLNALSAAKWRQVRRQFKFSLKKVHIQASAIRLKAQGPSDMKLEADDETMVITSEPGGSIHVTPRLQLWNESETDMAPIIVRGVEKRVVQAKLRFFHSPSGYGVGMHVRLTSNTPGHERSMDFASAIRLTEAPLAIGSVGTLNSIKENHSSAKRLWNKIHPETHDLFKAYVGNWGNF